jgi:hypothetical protein
MALPSLLPQRPKLFLDASSAGHHMAEILGAGLSDVADVTTSCAGIADASRTFDLAVFVLGEGQDTGMLLRIGVFLGALGRERVVIIAPASSARDLPAELRDVTFATYVPRGGGNDLEALGPAGLTIKEHVRRLTTPAGAAVASAPSAPHPASSVARRLRRSLGTARSVRSGQTLRIADISVTGALLETYGEIPEHQLLDLDITLEDRRSIRVTAKVVRVQYPQWGRVGGVGVAFTRFEGDSQATLARYFDAATASTDRRRP